MIGIIIAILSGAMMSIQGVFNTGVTKQTSIWTTATWGRDWHSDNLHGDKKCCNVRTGAVGDDYSDIAAYRILPY